MLYIYVLPSTCFATFFRSWWLALKWRAIIWFYKEKMSTSFKVHVTFTLFTWCVTLCWSPWKRCRTDVSSGKASHSSSCWLLNGLFVPSSGSGFWGKTNAKDQRLVSQKKLSPKVNLGMENHAGHHDLVNFSRRPTIFVEYSPMSRWKQSGIAINNISGKKLRTNFMLG